MRLFDGLREPDLRAFLGTELEQSSHASFAIRRVRLARVDLTPRELRNMRRCRVLLGRLDADALAGPEVTDGTARTATLLDLAASGRLEVRSAPLLTWDPDFALIGHGAPSDTLVIGSIQFAPAARRRPVEELALACATRDGEAVASAAVRFEELWERGHDCLEAITDALCRSRSAGDS